ncbi:MAG TPA: MerR family transcriptional regulator [Acidobacteriaceae bacterium]|jgi:effector-binding domain-containing protein|nr:MerR family transcriptional regulator [Acidobacteriaceae bacterium]
MLKIGDFSALAQVSIKTLRYYDQAGLLTPAHVDEQSGYRYYSVRQLAQLHRILALRDFEFSLEEIAELLSEDVTAEQMRGMLLLQQKELEQRMRDEGDRLSRLNSRIRVIERENEMEYEVILKNLPKQKIASVREVVAAYTAVGSLYGKVANGLGPAMANVTVPVAIWHDHEYKEKDVDAEAGFYLRHDVAAADGVTVHDLPETTAAAVIHNGSYHRLREAYDALLKWIASNDYQIAGPIRELYLHTAKPVRQDDETYVTEIQVPVVKAGAAVHAG